MKSKKTTHRTYIKGARKFTKKPINKKLGLTLAALILVVGIAAYVTRTRAANLTVSIEAESGTLTQNCASVMLDPAASKGKGLQLGCSGSLTSLDSSGRTIPKTNYAIPAGATFMSPSGNDSNDGKSVNSPVKTINAAVSKTAGGGTIVMRGGDYRDWYTGTASVPGTISKSITFQAYPGEAPWFNGADIVNDGWAASNGKWSRKWETPTFCGNKYYQYDKPPYTPQRRADGSTDTSIKQTSCMYEDAANDPSYPMAGNPQQVFINDERLQEVGSLAEVSQGKFFYDWYARTMHIGTDPAGKTVELSARPSAMILTGSDTDSHYLKGVGFKRYATNGSEGNTTGGVVYLTRKSVIENSVFSENATNGISLSNPRNGSMIKNSVVAYNGGTGLAANGASRTPGARNDYLLEGNIFNGNNYERGGLNCNRACGPAGVKMAHMVGFTVKSNIFENSYSRAPGVWCDLDCSDMITVNNVVRNNGGSGIFYEVSNKGIIASNLVYNNDGVGILVASANIKIYNNTVVNKYGPRVEAMRIYDDRRTPPSPTAVWPWYSPDVGPNTENVELANNLIAGPDTQNGARLIFAGNNATDAANNTADKYFSYFDYNVYYRLTAGQNLYYYIATDGYKTVADMQRLSNNRFEMNSFTVEAASPFVDRANQNFKLKTDSRAATEKGRALPSDVASALGLPAGSTTARGAINWVGSQ